MFDQKENKRRQISNECFVNLGRCFFESVLYIKVYHFIWNDQYRWKEALWWLSLDDVIYEKVFLFLCISFYKRVYLTLIVIWTNHERRVSPMMLTISGWSVLSLRKTKQSVMRRINSPCAMILRKFCHSFDLGWSEWMNTQLWKTFMYHKPFFSLNVQLLSKCTGIKQSKQNDVGTYLCPYQLLHSLTRDQYPEGNT